MAFQIRPDSEPIAGYRLVERLGTGGYGEVWKATAPGGLTKAIKIVFGHIGGERTEQELKALDRIRKARHPFLLSLERFEIIDGQLFIVTELADMSLMDRFNACKKAGMHGIARDELLGYLLDAADALDYLQKNYDLQHLDIKPQNLLLVGGRIKVADFGLVKDLQGTSATATGGVTPVYATPEAFDGRISRFSDQYSLAIVYEEMLTGIRPFPGTTALQLAAQHSSSPPLLTPLPVHDRPTIARALAKVPEQRFPTCREMIDNLVKAAAPASQSSKHAVQPAASAQPSSASLGEFGDSLSGVRTSTGATLPPQAEARITPSKKAAVTPRPKAAPKPELQDLEAFMPSGEACLRPTLVVGIGGIAGRVLRRWKQRLVWRFGTLKDVPSFQLLQIETDRRDLASLQERVAGLPLETEETLFLPLHEYMHYRKYKEEWLRWIHRQWLGDIPKSLMTEGKRPLGRLALIDNTAEATARLAKALEAANDPIARMRTSKSAGLIFRDESPQVFVVASINGGTGGGMLVDVAYLLRQILAEKNIHYSGPIGVLLHGTSQRPTERELTLGNACATLQELHHWTCAQGTLQSQAPVPKPPFQDCYLLHLGDRLSETQIQSSAQVLGDYLFINAAASMGGAIEQYRRSTQQREDALPDKHFLRTFLLSQIGFPRHRLANRVADHLSRKIVQRWNAGAEKTQDSVIEEANQYFNELGLDFDSLAVHLQSAAEMGLGEEPAAFFRRMFEEACAVGEGAASNPASPEARRAAWQQLENFYGAGKVTTEEENESLASTLALDLIKKQAQKTANEVSDKLVGWLEEAVENPEKRLPGAEAGAHAFLQKLRLLEARMREFLAEGKRSVTQTRARLADGNFSSRPTAISWFPLAQQSTDSKLRIDPLLAYALDRLGLVLVQDMATIYATIDKHLADFLQELTIGRQGLRLLAEGFTTKLPPGQQPAPEPRQPGWIELLPGGAGNIADGAREVLNRFDSEKIRELEQNFQQLYLQPRGGLWKTITAKEQPGDWLRDRLRNYLRTAALELLSQTDLPDMFLHAYQDCDEAKQALSDVVDAPSTELPVEDGWQHYIAALQPGEAGDALGELLHQVVPNVTRTLVRCEGNIIICQEIAHLSVAEIASTLIGEDESIKEIAHRLMTRIDVDWLPLEDVQNPCPA